jgi:hypothetical protein
MNTVFKEFLDAGYAYSFGNGPDVIRTETQAKQEGLNCVALMHLLIPHLVGVELPGNLRGWEMYCSNPFFRDVDGVKDMNLGDVLFFGRPTLPEYALQYSPAYDEHNELTNEEIGNNLIGHRYSGVHLAMNTGEVDDTENPLLIHANKMEGTVVIWSLAKFLDLKQYSTVHAIKRII